jgi:hypothetical protein
VCLFLTYGLIPPAMPLLLLCIHSVTLWPRPRHLREAGSRDLHRRGGCFLHLRTCAQEHAPRLLIRAVHVRYNDCRICIPEVICISTTGTRTGWRWPERHPALRLPPDPHPSHKPHRRTYHREVHSAHSTATLARTNMACSALSLEAATCASGVGTRSQVRLRENKSATFKRP